MKLTNAMQTAIPVWIEKYKQQPMSDVYGKLAEVSKNLPSLLGNRGEVLLFGGGEKGEMADLFNQTAESIALMSFIPGGIHIFGGYWETIHPEKESNET